MSSSNKDVKIAPGSVICLEAKLKGRHSISIGSMTVIHPKASVLAEAGPIVIGENNIIEEQASIVHSRADDDAADASPIPLVIGVNNVFEVGCEVRAKAIGDHNVFEPKCYVGPDVEIGSGCIVGAGCRLTARERLPDQSVVTGQQCTRRVAVDKPPDSDDLDRQNDELAVMKEIFTDGEFSDSSSGSEVHAIFDAHPTLPNNFTLLLTKDSGKTDFKINHLPPIRLLARLPPDYPSQSAPEFTLSCSWLNRDRLAQLVEEIQRLWYENKCEILFIWCSFLKDQCLEFLNIHDVYDLKERSVTDGKQGENRNGKSPCNGSVMVTKPVENDDPNNCWTHYASSSQRNRCYPPRNPRRYNGKTVLSPLRKPLDENEYLRKGKEKLIRQATEQLYTYRREAVNQLYFDMIEHNANRSNEEFSRKLQDCNVCFSSVIGEYCKQLGCGHVTCTECLRRMFEVHIKHGTMESIVCSQENCGLEIPTNLIQQLLSKEMFERYDRLMLSRTLDKITNMTYCPRLTCQYPVSTQGAEEALAICPSCLNAFCVFCKRAYHGIEGCKMNTDEKRELIEQYQSGNHEKKLELEKRYGKKQLADLVNAAQSELWMSENSKKCPCCNINIEKSDGCNKMICRKCNANFCWMCLKRLPSLNPYLHFQDPRSRCFNLLFEGTYDNNDDLGNDEVPLEPEFLVVDFEEPSDPEDFEGYSDDEEDD